MVVSIALGLVLVKVFDSLSHRDIVNKKLSRKLVHMLAGPGFMLCWPLFSAQASARYFAAVVPSLNIVRLLLIGFGIVEDPRTVKSVSRSGDKGELLRGPLYYVLVLLAATLTLWRTSPVPAVALALMCGGDGLADIAGRNLRGPSLPHNPRKTWAGSIAMFIGGSVMALGFLIFSTATIRLLHERPDLVDAITVSLQACCHLHSPHLRSLLESMRLAIQKHQLGLMSEAVQNGAWVQLADHLPHLQSLLPGLQQEARELCAAIAKALPADRRRHLLRAAIAAGRWDGSLAFAKLLDAALALARRDELCQDDVSLDLSNATAVTAWAVGMLDDDSMQPGDVNADPKLCSRLLQQADRSLQAFASGGAEQAAAGTAVLQQLLHALSHLLRTQPDRPLRQSISGLDHHGGASGSIGTQPSTLARQAVARDKAISLLKDAQAAAAQGKPQFLSGLLRTVAKTLVANPPVSDAAAVWQAFGHGPGLRLNAMTAAEENQQQDNRQNGGSQEHSSASSVLLDDPADLSGPDCLSAMLAYMAEVGDELASNDPAPAEQHNYFAFLHELPSALLARLLAQHMPGFEAWIQMQLRTNPSLASTSMQGQEKHAGAQQNQLHALLAAERWRDAIDLLDRHRTSRPPDWLLERAIDTATSMNSAGSSASRRKPHRRSSEAGTHRRSTAQSFSWQCCMRIQDPHQAATLALRHLGKWELQNALDLLQACACRLTAGGVLASDCLSQQLRTMTTLLRLYERALAGPAGHREFKSWQHMHTLFEGNAEMLIRRLLNQDDVTLAAELLALCDCSDDLVVEVHSRQLQHILEAPIAASGGILEVMRHLQQMSDGTQAMQCGIRLLHCGSSQQDRRILLSWLSSLPDSTPELYQLQLGFKCLSVIGPQWEDRLGSLVSRPDLLVESLVMNQQFALAAKVLELSPGRRNDDMLLSYARKAASFLQWGDSQTSDFVAAAGAASPVRMPSGDALLLAGDDVADDSLRKHFSFATAPSTTLVTAILQLSSSPATAACLARTLARELAEVHLSQDPTVLAASDAAMEEALEAAALVAQILEFASQQLSAAPARSEGPEDRDAQQLAERVELVQMLLGHLVPVSLAELSDEAQAHGLVDRLLQQEHYPLAVFVSRRCGLAEQPCWLSWARALIMLGEYDEAEKRLANAFLTTRAPADGCQDAEGNAENARQMVAALEETQPINLSGLQQWWKQLEQTMQSTGDVSMSSGDYLQVLAQPMQSASPEQVAWHSLPEQRMDGKRLALGRQLLLDHAPSDLPAFLFKWERAAEACELMYPPVPGNNTQQYCHPCESEASDPLDARFALDALLHLCVQHGQLSTLRPAAWSCVQLAAISSTLGQANTHMQSAVIHLHDVLREAATMAPAQRGQPRTSRDVSRQLQSASQLLAQAQAQADVFQAVRGMMSDDKLAVDLVTRPSDWPISRMPLSYFLFQAQSDLADDGNQGQGRRGAVVQGLLAAQAGDHAALKQLLANIQGTAAADDFDKVLGEAAAACLQQGRGSFIACAHLPPRCMPSRG
ncbi:hypothetical protein WJX73_002678 [Symbiochloris irregularis]|uniref:Uncharacterized protein n=1 Tax=Symbiochloris irregularis TaxID=706552 RepID=A0AAW1NUF0_9CHLO